EIEMPRLLAEMLEQRGEPEIEPPPRHELGAAPRLDAPAVALDPVHQPDRQLLSGRKFRRSDVVVQVEEQIDGERGAQRRLPAKAGLEGDQFLGDEAVALGEQGQEFELAVDPRWRAHRARDRGPEQGALVRLPGEADVGQDFEAGEAGLLELHAPDQRDAAAEPDAVLEETVI